MGCVDSFQGPKYRCPVCGRLWGGWDACEVLDRDNGHDRDFFANYKPPVYLKRCIGSDRMECNRLAGIVAKCDKILRLRA